MLSLSLKLENIKVKMYIVVAATPRCYCRLLPPNMLTSNILARYTPPLINGGGFGGCTRTLSALGS